MKPCTCQAAFHHASFLGKSGVPRKTPLSEREIQICQRLRQARQSTKLSQVAFARILGIDSSRLASHEHARVPLRFGLAHQAAGLARVSVGWLASGEGPANMQVRIDPATFDRIDKDRLLSEVYDSLLKRFFDPLVESAKKNPLGSGPKIGLANYWKNPIFIIGEIRREDVSDGVHSYLEKLLDSVPLDLYSELWSDALDVLIRFRQRHAEEIVDFAKSPAAKTHLTEAATSEKLLDVKPKLPALLERLKKATSETGKMSALADYLHVPLASVSRWLSGKREPGGEITLKLLHWVEQQERQK